MGMSILFCFRPVKRRKDTVDIDPLADRRIPLEPQLVLPQFCLAGKYQRHRAHGIEPVVQEEAEFLQHLLFKKVCFVQNAYDVFMLDPADELDLLLKLTLGIAPVEAGFQTQLVEASTVEPPRRQL